MSIAYRAVDERVAVEFTKQEVIEFLTNVAKDDVRIKKLLMCNNFSEYTVKVVFKTTEGQINGTVVSFEKHEDEKIK